MSLELAVQENTAALRELIAALVNGGLPTSAAQVSAVVTEVKAKPEPKAKTEVKPETVKETPKAKPEKDNTDDLAGGEIVLQQVIDVTLALGKAGKRAELVELLGEFGVAKSSLLDPSDFASFHAKATALLEG